LTRDELFIDERLVARNSVNQESDWHPDSAVVDIGNSWAKFGTYRQTAPEHWCARARIDWRSNLESELPLLDLPQHPMAWMISSVHQQGTQILRDWLVSSRPQDAIHEVTHKDFEFRHAVDEPSKTGIDRFCAVAGALAICKKAKKRPPFVIADIGTAVTVDFVDRDSVFCGGTIFLGPLKALEELGQHTDALPNVQDLKIESDLAPIGTNTVAALKAGAVFSLVGAIKEIARLQFNWGAHVSVQHDEIFDDDVAGEMETVIVTGGGSPFVRDFVPKSWMIVEDLVLRGIQSVVPANSKHH